MQVQNYLQLLQTQRKNLQEVEIRRDIMSKQLAMVREAETLGAAMGSHQLNSLSQRYNVYKRTKNEFTNTRNILLAKSVTNKEHLSAFIDCIKLATSPDRPLHTYSNEIENISDIVNISEFDIVKELLDNSAQGAVYLQSEQLRKELDSSYLQVTAIGKQALQAISQYCDVVSYHPQSYIAQHRLSKYAEWCDFLAENQTVQACRDVVTQFQAALGEAAIKPSAQQVNAFSCQLHAQLCEENCKLEANYERLGTDDIEQVSCYNIKSNIAEFLIEHKGSVQAFECVALRVLCDLNQRLLLMENAAHTAAETLQCLTSNGKWFLDELYGITSILVELTSIIASNDNFDQDFMYAINTLRSSNQIYSGLRNMHTIFYKDILRNTLHGIISQDSSILDMISAVSSLQEGMQPIHDLLTNLHIHLRCTVMNMQSTQQQVACTDVQNLKQRLAKMKLDYGGQQPQTAGSRLFSKFMSLFDELDVQHQEMVGFIAKLKMPSKWKKIDLIKESKDLSVSKTKMSSFFLWCFI